MGQHLPLLRGRWGPNLCPPRPSDSGAQCPAYFVTLFPIAKPPHMGSQKPGMRAAVPGS